MKEKIIITQQPFDEKHYITFFSIESKDIGFKLHICEFNREMEELFYDCQVKIINGKTGFVFENSISIDEIEFEAKRFISQYNLNK